MKIALRLILIISLLLIASGAYMNMESAGDGEKFIGMGVVIFAFLLMPLFIYHRYKNKDLSSYSFKNNWWENKDKQ